MRGLFLLNQSFGASWGSPVGSLSDSPSVGTQLPGTAPEWPQSHDETWLHQPAEVGSASFLDIRSPYPHVPCNLWVLLSSLSPGGGRGVSCPTKQCSPRALCRLSESQLSSLPSTFTSTLEGIPLNLSKWLPVLCHFLKRQKGGRGAPFPHTGMHTPPKEPPGRRGEMLFDHTRVYLGGREEGV